MNEINAAKEIRELKNIVSELLESENKFRTIADAAEDAIIMIDDRGLISHWNPAAERISGFTAEEALGKKMASLIMPLKYREAHEKGFSKFKATGQGPVIGKTVELSAIKKDKTEFPIELSLSAVKLKGKWNAIGILRDITERKQAEAALLREKQSLEIVTRFTNCALFILDDQTKVAFANKVAEEWFGPVSDIGGKLCCEVFSLKDPEKECAGLEVLRSGKTVRKETHAKLLGNKEKYVFIDASPIKDDSGNIQQIVEIVLDVTERKQAEDLLRESELWMRGIFNAQEDAVFVVSPDRIVVNMNSAAEKIFGYTHDEIKNLSTKIIHVDDGHYQKFGKLMWGAFTKGEKAHFEYEFKRKNGRIFPTEVSITLIKDEMGKPTGIVGVIRDITERKRAEKTIKRMAYYDMLTKLPNRRLFKDRMVQALANAQRNNHQVAVLSLDLNRFKLINDTMGHDAGDQLLRAVAVRLGHCVRRVDTVARVGGEYAYCS